MSENRPRRRVWVMVVGVLVMIAGAVVIGASQTVFAPKTVRFKNAASGNSFAMSDEQVLRTLPFTELDVGDGRGIRDRIAKRHTGTAIGAGLVGLGLIVALLGLRRRRAAKAPADAGEGGKPPTGAP